MEFANPGYLFAAYIIYFRTFPKIHNIHPFPASCRLYRSTCMCVNTYIPVCVYNIIIYVGTFGGGAHVPRAYAGELICESFEFRLGQQCAFVPPTVTAMGFSPPAKEL